MIWISPPNKYPDYTLIWWLRNCRVFLLKNVSYEFNKYKPFGHFSKAMSTDLQAMANIGCTGVMSAAPTSKEPFGVPASRSSMIRLITLSIWRELLNASLASLWSAAKMCGAPIIIKVSRLKKHLTITHSHLPNQATFKYKYLQISIIMASLLHFLFTWHIDRTDLEMQLAIAVPRDSLCLCAILTYSQWMMNLSK